MLLTSSQISMGISSSIVFFFTSLLFLSGYVLQQQTVHNLQAVINPPPISVSHSAAPQPIIPEIRLSFEDDSRVNSGYFLQNILDLGRRKPRGGWKKVTYAQVVRDHIGVCNAMMSFAALDKAGSRAGRVLFVPRRWIASDDHDGDDQLKAGMDTTRRLLRTGVRKFGVILRALDDDEEGLVPLFGLTEYTRVLHLPPSGLLLAPDILDQLFFDLSDSPIISISPLSSSVLDADSDQQSNILLLRPAFQIYTQLRSSPLSPVFSILKSLSTAPYEPPPSDHHPLILLTTSYLTFPNTLNDNPDLNLALLLPSPPSSPTHPRQPAKSPRRPKHSPPNPTPSLAIGYIHITALTDSLQGPLQAIGPEHDIPLAFWTAAMPHVDDPDARAAWNRIYDRYREDRRGICGLDLEPWSPNLPMSRKEMM